MWNNTFNGAYNNNDDNNFNTNVLGVKEKNA